MLTMFASPVDNDLFGYLLLSYFFRPKTVDFVLMRPNKPFDDLEPVFMWLVLPPTTDESELRFCINDLGSWQHAYLANTEWLHAYQSTAWQVLDYKGIVAAIRDCYYDIQPS